MTLNLQATDRVSATLGGRNILDKYPKPGGLDTCCGQIYPDTAADWFGRQVYLSLNVNF